MPEKNVQVQEQKPQVQGPTPQAQEPKPQVQEKSSEEKLNEAIAVATAAIEDKFKSEVAGLNRKNEELRKAVEAERLAKLTEEERAKAEKDIAMREATEELDRIRKETAELKRKSLITAKLADAGIPLEFAKHISSETEELITVEVTNLKTFLDAQVAAGIEAEIKKKFGGKAPEGGAGGAGGTKMSIDDIAKIPDRAERAKLYKENGYVK